MGSRRHPRATWVATQRLDLEQTVAAMQAQPLLSDEERKALEGDGRVVARYLDDNPNGSLRDIAGVSNERGNVVGLMPHPEHAVEDLTGPGTDGLGFFTSLVEKAFA